VILLPDDRRIVNRSAIRAVLPASIAANSYFKRVQLAVLVLHRNFFMQLQLIEQTA
jgi:hypothetical protein